MSDTLIDITGKLDSLTIELFIAVNEVMAKVSTEYLVIGASARDLVLHFGYNSKDIQVSRNNYSSRQSSGNVIVEDHCLD